MIKKLLKIFSLAAILLIVVLACRTNEEFVSENKSQEKIGAFVNFEKKISQKGISGKNFETVSYAEPFQFL